jgi:hypothetical protein
MRSVHMRALRHKPLVLLGIILWIFATGFGFLKLVRFENAPGEATAAPSQWPQSSEIRRDATRPTLVMILHPQCSCSRAALGELALIMSRADGRADAHALFFRPSGVGKEWVQNDLWRDAAAIPGVEARIDDQGKEARLFHATTSGSVVLYDRDGRLIFEGGITPSRSHSGDNAGRSAIVALLNGGLPERTRTFVFGCSLLDSRTPGDEAK